MTSYLSFLIIPLLLVPIILQYNYQWSFTQFPQYTFSIYSVYLLIYTTIQYVLSYLNNRVTHSRTYSTEASVPLCNIMVVGWKEEPEYFRNCLESIHTTLCNLYNIHKIFVIIDGDAPDDHYMINIFLQVFNDTSIIKSTHIHIDSDTNLEQLVHSPDYQNHNVICITQTHSGKRHAMYTGFKLSLLDRDFFDLQTILCTDSDTVLSPDCLQRMLTVSLNDTSESISGVSGALGIYNRYESFISFMSSLRYFYAFNIERAYQSYNGYLLCISGPIGLYRLKYIEKILETWKNQSFLGKPCTYGDDRHLTNQILSLNTRVVFTPTAYAETETPSAFYRFYQQQTRWNKSSIREFLWTLPLVDHFSLFLTIDLVYTLLFPFIVIGWLLYLLFAGTIYQLGLYSCMFLGIGFIKGVYATIVYKQYECVFYFLYGYIYIGITFPSRLWALFNITDTNWGTSMRLFKNQIQSCSSDIIAPVLWNSILLSGLAFSFYRNYHEPLQHYLLFIIPHSISALSFIFVHFYINVKIQWYRNIDWDKFIKVF